MWLLRERKRGGDGGDGTAAGDRTWVAFRVVGRGLRRGDGGARNTKEWAEAEAHFNRRENDGKPKTGRAGVCPFKDGGAVWRALRESSQYKEYVKEKPKCSAMKRKLRKLVVDYHPDKFRHLYPGCDSDLSTMAFTEIQNEHASACG